MSKRNPAPGLTPDESTVAAAKRPPTRRLSERDSLLLAEALINPPEPTPALVRAYERYRRGSKA